MDILNAHSGARVPHFHLIVSKWFLLTVVDMKCNHFWLRRSMVYNLELSICTVIWGATSKNFDGVCGPGHEDHPLFIWTPCAKTISIHIIWHKNHTLLIYWWAIEIMRRMKRRAIRIIRYWKHTLLW